MTPISSPPLATSTTDNDAMEIVVSNSVPPMRELVGYENLQIQQLYWSADESILEVERILNYKFINKKLLEDALTHPSYVGASSYERLEFIGDAVLGSVMANFVFLAYPELDQGQLSLLRAANISTEKLARVAVHHGLYRFVKHNAVALEQKVREFVEAVRQEDESAVYGGTVKAPKVLADIVESIAGAIYYDCDFNVQIFWNVFRVILEPIITLETLMHYPQPVTMLFEVCQKQGKKVDIKYWRKDAETVASVYVDEKLIASDVSDQKETAKLNAARIALRKLTDLDMVNADMTEVCCKVNDKNEIEEAKQKLHQICRKQKWIKPSYMVVNESGPSHEKTYISVVKLQTHSVILQMQGEKKSRVKDAENSAASLMILSLVENRFI